jgi:nucleoside phosphorylase
MLLVVAATEPELAGVAGAAPVCVCGIGPVEAAAGTAAALASERPAAVLHIGLAGARRGSGIEAPALVIGSEALYEDVTGRLAPRRAIPDAALLSAARRALPDARVLTIGTSASVGGTSTAPIEAMEGFAVLRAAELAGVPAIEVRAVANEIEEPDRGRWRIADALETLGKATPALVESLLPCAS